ncbi:SufE family protein [Pseudoalteromonas fenneropenaei]|uniref:SufE family protein n=1 Tax=Pseudoalteromonas fenneropenaei TaxID=1737459 RepID=A0ABV7CHK5_9GAMM
MNFNDIRQQLEQSSGWQAKYRTIMLLGKQLPELPEPLKTPAALVKGCESKVWLHVAQNEQDGKLAVVADSDTRIVKGLLAIILAFYNGKTPLEVSKTSAVMVFNELQLLQHLSPSRGNGVHAIDAAIQTFASQVA